MDILWTLIVGGVVGWLASIVMKSNAQMGLIGRASCRERVFRTV